MSADNYVGVLRKTLDDGYEYFVVDGNASIDSEDCQYVGNVVGVFSSREDALVAAHNYADKLPVLEYGVHESVYPQEPPCGKCYVCINERGIVAEDVQRCDRCHEPISTSEWMTSTYEGTFHSRCENGS